VRHALKILKRAIALNEPRAPRPFWTAGWIRHGYGECATHHRQGALLRCSNCDIRKFQQLGRQLWIGWRSRFHKSGHRVDFLDTLARHKSMSQSLASGR
jgi:hypothetical protein